MESGSKEKRRGQPSLPSSKLNKRKNRKVWRLDHPVIYLHDAVFQTWRSMRSAATFSSDSSFAAYLLGLELKRREKHGLGGPLLSAERDTTKASIGKRFHPNPVATSTPMKRKDLSVPESVVPVVIADTSDSVPESAVPVVIADTSDSVLMDVEGSFHSVVDDMVFVADTGYAASSSDEDHESSDEDNELLLAEKEAEEVSMYLQEALKEVQGVNDNASTDSESSDVDSISDDEDNTAQLDDSIVLPDSDSENVDIEMEQNDAARPAPIIVVQRLTIPTPWSTQTAVPLPDTPFLTHVAPEQTCAPRFTRLEELYEVKKEVDIVKSTKFICTVDKLEALLQRTTCDQEGCSLPVTITKKKVQGCTLITHFKCMAGHKGRWESSHVYNRLYSNNVQVAVATLLSGNNFAKLELLAKCLNLNFISQATYYRIQSLYTIPVVEEWWSWMRKQIIEDLLGDVLVSGDGQCDSPGHSAKYLCYYLMESVNNYIIHIEIIDKRETAGKSSAMEKEALKRALHHLKNIINLMELVTDASSSIKKLMADEFLEVFHSLDIWHKAKTIRKAISKVSKPKSMAKIQKWTGAIVNHFWYCCEVASKESTHDDALNVLKSKWLSILHHICNEHDWTDGRCDHEPINEEDQHELPWFDKRDKDFETLQKVVCEPSLLESFKHYVRFRHTGELESVNALSLMYAPKRCAFQNNAYRARKTLAAIDHNFHVGRKVARVTKKFNPRTKVWDEKKVKVPKSYGYFPVMQANVLRECSQTNKNMRSRVPMSADDPRRIAPTIAPVAAPQVIRRRSRFPANN